MLKTRSFLAKRCKKTFIFDKKTQKTPTFTLIFSPKTNKSYKITLFTIANHPVFQKNRKKTDFLKNSPQKIMKPIESNWFFQQLAGRICYNIAYLTSKSKRMGRGD